MTIEREKEKERERDRGVAVDEIKLGVSADRKGIGGCKAVLEARSNSSLGGGAPPRRRR